MGSSRLTEQVSLFERVPDDSRMGWGSIAAILSGVVSSLSKLMGGGIVAFYAGCQLGSVAAGILFVLGTVLTYLVGRISYEEGLPNNVTSRFYVFGTKGSVVGSLIWIFLLVGVLAVGTVQLGNAIMYYFGLTSPWMKVVLFLAISGIWILISLFGVKFIARFNGVFVALLFAALAFVVVKIALDGDMGDALTHGIMVPGVSTGDGFAYGLNYCVMTSGLMALFAADFTRFLRKKSDLVPVSLFGSIVAIVTYVFGALLTYYGYEQSVAYFESIGYDAAGAANAAITNPGVTLVLALGFAGLLIICLSQMKVETSNSIGGANAVSNLFDALFGMRLPWPVAVVIANAVGLVFIFGNILDKVNAFMSVGSILTMSWCFLLITDYYLVRGVMHIGSRGIVSLKHIEAVNWRGVVTIAVTTVVCTVLYTAKILMIPLLLAAPLTMGLYIMLSVAFRDQVRARDAQMRACEQAEVDGSDEAAASTEVAVPAGIAASVEGVESAEGAALAKDVVPAGDASPARGEASGR
ncbi:MAG: hypothetical protein SOI38_05330 [Eggerthellaceae bacterium]